MSFLCTHHLHDAGDWGGDIVFKFFILAYVRMYVHPPVRMCACTSVRGPVRLRLRHLNQVETILLSEVAS